MKYSDINNELGHLCRDCINERFDLKLMPVDCRYMMYPSVCKECRKIKNIVEGIKLSKRISIRLGCKAR